MKVKKDAGSSYTGENSSSINRNKEIRKIEDMEESIFFYVELELTKQFPFHYPLSHSAFQSFPLDLGSGNLAVYINCYSHF